MLNVFSIISEILPINKRATELSADFDDLESQIDMAFAYFQQLSKNTKKN